MTFARPDMLVWLWLLPLAAAILVFAERRRRARLAAFCGRGPTAARVRGGLVALKGGLALTALAATIVALAQPRWGFEWTDVKRRGIDLVVAVDVSRSMLASDVDPSRLERAKRKLADLLAMLEGDLVGLVAFAGDAFVQCPLTEDYGAVRLFASYLDPSLIPVQGTDLGKAISAAMRALQEGGRGAGSGEAEDAGASQAIILITDGEDNEGKGLEEAAKAKAAGIKIYTIAVGSDAGAPIPEGSGGFKKDAQGNLVLTKPDEASLQKIALETGGLFVRSVASDADLVQIYAQSIRKSLTEKDIRETRHKLWYERYQWFVALAMAFLTLEWLIRDVRLATVLVLALSAFPSGNARAGTEKDAHADYAQGEYAKAAKGFLEVEVESPEAPDKAYNRAASQYKAKDFANAASGFAKAAEAPGSPRELAQRSRFNEGNAWVGANKLDDAIKAYEQALELDANDVKAKENLEYAKKIKEQQEQEKKQDKNQQQKQDQDQQKQDQDQQKQDQSQDQQKQDQSQDQQKQDQSQDQQKQDQSQDQQKQDQSQDQQKQDQSQDQQKQDQSQDQQKQNQQAQDGQPSSQDQAQQGSQEQQQPTQSPQGAGSKPQPARAEAMTKEEAEQVLRSAEDQIGRFLFSPKQTKSRQNPGKDW